MDMPMFLVMPVMVGMAMVVCMVMRRPMAVHMHHRLRSRSWCMGMFVAVAVAHVVRQLAVFAAVAR